MPPKTTPGPLPAMPRPPHGPGQELKRILAWFGIHDQAGCGCQEFATLMDFWGPEGCEQHFQEIVDRLLGQAAKRPLLRHLPRKAAEVVVRMAIRAAKRKAAHLRRQRVVSGVTLPETLYITTAQLMQDALALAGHLPPDANGIVAIARSGLLPATLWATVLHLPLWCTGPEGQILPLAGGIRTQDQPPEWRQPRHLLLVDDTAWSGHAMRTWSPRVQQAFPGAAVTRAAVYSHPNGLASLDLCWALYEGPHYLEWNWLNSGHAERLATDLDGILCEERTGRPMQMPRRRPVLAIVTARPEHQRSATEAWLARYGAVYRRLVMGPWQKIPTDAATIGRWKAKQCQVVGAQLFVESDPSQAAVIHAATGIPVLCPALGHLLA
ncbi:hypothetical protein [Thermopirellula anaerolimosa]